MIKIKEQKNSSHGKKRTLAGIVVSDKMLNSIVVEVTRLVRHKKYGKFIKRTKRYKAHDAGNKHSIGDKVRIEECTPISKEKRFRVTEEQSNKQNIEI